MVFGKRKKKVEPDESELPEMPKPPQVPKAFARRVSGMALKPASPGLQEPEVEEEEEVEEIVEEQEPDWEVFEIPASEVRYVLRNKKTGEEVEADLQKICDFLNQLYGS